VGQAAEPCRPVARGAGNTSERRQEKGDAFTA